MEFAEARVKGNHQSRKLFLGTAIAAATIVSSSALMAQRPYTTWRVDKGSPDSSNYSALSQINRSNVAQLEIAWKFPTGDNIEYPFDPIVIDNVAYVLAKRAAIVAIDATTGKEIWTHSDPRGGSLLRGLSYWESKDRSDRRLLFCGHDHLVAIDARTGLPVESFGDHGEIDLKPGLGRDPKIMGRIQSTSPGRVFENLIILGSTTGESYLSLPGDVRAFDVVTGKLAWQFHTIPHPGEPGYETWPKDAWKYAGGANNWADMTLDEKRGIVYLPLGSPTYDFYGGDRAGNNLYGDSLIALNARTGKLVWYFQDVHHDLWDYDLVSAPQLLSVRHNGKMVDVVGQAGKNGFLFVLNRDTGKPIWPIVERPVPQSDVPGEHSSPTQPFPTKPAPFARQTFTANDINPYFLTDEERAKWKKIVSEARNEGIYTPPALGRFSVNMPGHSGGSSLFGTSADPSTGTMYVVSFDGPALLRLERNEKDTQPYTWLGPIASNYGGFEQIGRLKDEASQSVQVSPEVAKQGRTVYEQNCQMCHGANLAGGNGGAPNIQGVVAKLGEKGVRTMVMQGSGPMPSFASLPDTSVDLLVTYLKTQIPQPTATGVARVPFTQESAYPEGVDAPQRLYSGYGYSPALIGPPWSTITAYDLNTGEIKWKVPDGEAVGVSPAGNNFGIIQFHGPKAGLAITGGGLIFQATTERKLRAFDKTNGKVLWSVPLPDRAQGTPAIYEVGGRQYVLVTTRGNYLAFALPKK